MIDEKTVAGLRSKYQGVHPLIFARSVERAKTGGDLFDILFTIPDEYPLVWDDGIKRWVKTDDPYLAREFKVDQANGDQAADTGV